MLNYRCPLCQESIMGHRLKWRLSLYALYHLFENHDMGGFIWAETLEYQPMLKWDHLILSAAMKKAFEAIDAPDVKVHMSVV